MKTFAFEHITGLTLVCMTPVTTLSLHFARSVCLNATYVSRNQRLFAYTP